MFPPWGESQAVAREGNEEEVGSQSDKQGLESGPSCQLFLGLTTFLFHGTLRYSCHQSSFFGFT